MKNSTLTLSERIDRAAAAIACEKVMSLHCLYHAGGIHLEEIEELWTEREDCTWSRNFGQMNNRSNYLECYADAQEVNSVQNYEQLKHSYPEVTKVKDRRALIEVAMHLLASPVLEVAEDGRSAKGLWYTPGCIFSTLTPQKEKEGLWMWERYGADFILENGKWVFLNLNVCCDMEGMMDAENWPFMGTPGGQPPDAGSQGMPVGIPGPLHYRLSDTQVPQERPYIPQPYRTFEEICSYATLTGIYEKEGK